MNPVRYPDVICKVCDQRLRILTGTHLRKHGLTLAEYKLQYETPPLAADTVIPFGLTEREARGQQIMETVADWMIGRPQINEMATRALNNLLDKGRERFKVAMMTVALAKIDRVSNLIAALAMIQKRLFDPVYLATAPVSELMELHKLVSVDLTATVSVLERIVDPKDQGQRGGIHQVLMQFVQAENAIVNAGEVSPNGTPIRLPKDPDQRRRMALLYSQLRAVVPPVEEQPV